MIPFVPTSLLPSGLRTLCSQPMAPVRLLARLVVRFLLRGWGYCRRFGCFVLALWSLVGWPRSRLPPVYCLGRVVHRWQLRRRSRRVQLRNVF